jgi:hypothetical protein
MSEARADHFTPPENPAKDLVLESQKECGIAVAFSAIDDRQPGSLLIEDHYTNVRFAPPAAPLH